MKLPLIAAALTAALSGQALAQDAVGLWRTETNGGQVEIARCGNSLCGKLVTSNRIKADPSLKDSKNKDESQRERPLKGLQMLYGFTADGDGKWSGGKVYNPDDGGTYSGTITLKTPDSLKLKGCIVAPLCKTQVWTRVK